MRGLRMLIIAGLGFIVAQVGLNLWANRRWMGGGTSLLHYVDGRQKIRKERMARKSRELRSR